MTLATVAFNGTDIESLGLVLADADGLHSLTKRAYPTAQIAGKPGLTVVGAAYTSEVRRVPFRFEVTPTSFTDRSSKLAAIRALFPGLVAVTCVDAPSKVVYGRLEESPVTTPFKVFGTAAVYDGPVLVCHDPNWYDGTAVTQTISANTSTAISNGDEVMRKITIDITGPVTNPIVILRDQAENELARMTLTGQLFDPSTATALQPVSLSIDCDAYAITGTRKNGTTFDAISWLGSLEQFFECRLSETVSGFKLFCAEVDLSVSHYRAYSSV